MSFTLVIPCHGEAGWFPIFWIFQTGGRSREFVCLMSGNIGGYGYEID